MAQQQPIPPSTVHTLSPPAAPIPTKTNTTANGLTLQAYPPKGYPPQASLPHAHQRPHSPLHPSVLPLLDSAYVELYNHVMAYWPPPPTDINIVREHYSSIYRFAMKNPSGVGGIGETVVPGWSKYPGEINVRVYVPPGEELGTRKVWPVHFNFHGGGMFNLHHHIIYIDPCLLTQGI